MVATVSEYRYKAECDNLDGRPIDSTLLYNVSDMLYWDPNDQLYKSDITDTVLNTLPFAGICLSQVPTASIGDRVADVRGISVYVGRSRDAYFEMKTTDKEAYYEGTPVGVGADAQTVSLSATNKIGLAVMRPLEKSVAGAEGVTVRVVFLSTLFNAGYDNS